MSDSDRPQGPTTPPPAVGRIWHISDLHLDPTALPGSPDDKARVGAEDAFELDVFQGLIQLAQEEPADALIFSGDFYDAGAGARVADEDGANSLRTRAFEAASDFIERLAEAHRLSEKLSTHVIVCPGNHDVDWSIAAQDPGRSRQEFERAMLGFVQPSAKNPWLVDDHLGLCVLVLDTASLSGTVVSSNDDLQAVADALAEAGSTASIDQLRAALLRVLQHDIAAFSTTHIQELARRLPDAVCGMCLSPALLGIVVSHHPPCTVPTGAVEVKAFETPIAAAQAREILRKLGFTVFLHGHKHRAWIQSDQVHGNGMTDVSVTHTIGAGPLVGSGIPGFNVIDYAVSRVNGEARLVITPYTLDGGTPTPKRPTFLSIAPRANPPARLRRTVVRINDHGDARLDTYWHQMPTSTWPVEGNRRSKRFPWVVEAPHSQFCEPQVRSLQPETEVRVERAAKDFPQGKIRGETVIQVPIDQPDVTLVERWWYTNAFSVSREHARRIRGAPKLHTTPDQRDPLSYEHLYEGSKEPLDQLEIFICLPFESEKNLRVAVRTHVTKEDGSLERAPHLERFTRSYVDKVLFAKRIRVAVREPLVGAVYEVRWELPNENPTVERLGQQRRNAYWKALEEAEELRQRFSSASGSNGHAIKLTLEAAVQVFLGDLERAGACGGADEVEWAVFVPDAPLYVRAGAPEDDGAPRLKPVCANYKEEGLWAAEFVAGCGVAGRAYATNSPVRFRSGPRHGRDPWLELPFDVYIPVEGGRPHTVMYGLPIRHDTEDLVVLGCLCLGSYTSPANLNLDARIEAVDPVEGMPDLLEAEIELMRRMKKAMRECISQL